MSPLTYSLPLFLVSLLSLSLPSVTDATSYQTTGSIPTLSLANTLVPVHIPRILLGTGGGNGGYNTTAWLTVNGPGYDTAQTYCYNAVAPYCSPVSIFNSLIQTQTNPDSLFIISKIEPEDFGTVDTLTGFGRPITRGILQEMSLPSINMLMFHQAGRHETDTNPHPNCFNISGATNGQGTYAQCRIETFLALRSLLSDNTTYSVGVSNWQIRELQQVYNATGIYPSALEIEVHPYWHEDDLINFCIANNITVINYAPLALGTQYGLLSDPAVVAVAQNHQVTPAQAVLRWGLQKTQGIVIPRSANVTHMIENMNIFDFELTDTEMQSLSVLPQKKIFNVYCQPWC